MLPIYLFPYSNILGLKTMLKVDLLHNLGLWLVDRPVDRQTLKVRNLTFGRSTGQSTDSPFWLFLKYNG